MRPVSVKELAAVLNEVVAEGKGDYIVLVSDDEECNGTHALFECFKSVYRGEDYEFVDGKERKIRNTIVLV